jgi:hypothetical protein
MKKHRLVETRCWKLAKTNYLTPVRDKAWDIMWKILLDNKNDEIHDILSKVIYEET